MVAAFYQITFYTVRRSLPNWSARRRLQQEWLSGQQKVAIHEEASTDYLYGRALNSYA
jgi:hypothetical protein